MFTQSVKFYTFHCHILKSANFWKRWFIKQTENERLLLSASFTADFELVFWGFQNNPPFERSTCFYVTITGNSEGFQYFDFKTNFLKNENRFQKNLEYHLFVESTAIENATFPHKTALSEANVKANRMGITKWIHLKEQSFARTILFFWKFCFSLRTSYKDLIWCTNYPNVHIHTFCKRCSFIWGCYFPVSILNIWGSTKIKLSHILVNLMTNIFNCFSPIASTGH